MVTWLTPPPQTATSFMHAPFVFGPHVPSGVLGKGPSLNFDPYVSRYKVEPNVFISQSLSDRALWGLKAI